MQRNCVLILTTNLGAADSEKNSIGFGGDFQDNSYEDKLLRNSLVQSSANRFRRCDYIC